MKNERHMSARYKSFGDNALLVEFGNTIDLETNKKVIAFDNAIATLRIQGIEELVPSYRSLLIRYNPMKLDYEQLASCLENVEKTLEEWVEKTEGREVTIPVVYGEAYGPDLEYVARYHGLTENRVIKLHSEREYRVYMIGFVAGFPYLGKVADEIATSRLETPRLKVPAGSVGIAESQTGIYPCEAPGGWRIIGRTPVKLFDPLQEPPAFLRPGDTVRFKPIPETEYEMMPKEK